MKWSENAWQSIDEIYRSILQMPFIEELSNGSLPLNKFQFYMLQDSLYLEHFGRALALIGAKAHHINETLLIYDLQKMPSWWKTLYTNPILKILACPTKESFNPS